MLYLLTRAQCQICVFHTEVCPNAFTCCRQRFEIFIGRCDTKPINTASVPFDCDMFDSPVPLPVLVKSISDFIKLPFMGLWIPLAKSQRDTIIGQRPARLFKRERFELMPFFDPRLTAEFLEEADISIINAFQFLLYCLTRQGVPMRVRRPFQVGYM